MKTKGSGPMPSLIPKTLFIAGAAAAIAARQASATLTIDLRAASVNGVPTVHPKCVVAIINDLVRFDVYTIVTGPTEAPGLEGFQIAVGSILSNTSNTGVHGNVETRQFVSPFGAAGATSGLVTDLDGDGDLDVGSNSTTAATADNISARSASMTLGNASGLGASEFKFYSFTLRLTSSGDNTPLTINWRKTDFTGLTTEYVWMENGVLTNTRGGNGGSVAQVQLGSPVLFTLACPYDTPEPTASVLVLAGALGLAGLRRIGVKSRGYRAGRGWKSG